MYSIHGYGEMIADSLRFDAYTEALRRAVKPGSVVVDIGTGTGIFAMLACQFGASKVVAIEPDNAIQVARAMAASNGCADRIEFIQGLSTGVTLPAPADVIVSDMRGILPLCMHHIASIADARLRLLAPGGVLIPQRDTLWGAVVEASELYDGILSGYAAPVHGLRLDAARSIVTNNWKKARVRPEQLLTEAINWASIDYLSVTDPNFAADVCWTVGRSGTAHGISLWFDATLTEGVTFSNAPGEPELIYGSAFYPLAAPVPLCAGDHVCCKLRADLIGNDYLWRWETRVLDQGRAEGVKASFVQSTLQGVAFSLASQRKRADNYIPNLSEDGQIDGFILARMDGEGGRSNGEIARQVSARFPARFADWKQALTRVADLSTRYGR